MKAENTPITGIKQDLTNKIGHSCSHSNVSSFVTHKQYFFLTFKLKEAEIVDWALFPNRIAFATITNNYGITHKTNKLQIQERRVNDGSSPTLYMNLKKTSQIKFYYELSSPSQQSSLDSIKSQGQNKRKKSSMSSLNKMSFQKKNLRNILITLNSDQLSINKAMNKSVFALINPKYFKELPLRQKKYFSFPLLMEEDGESQIKGEIKIKIKVDLDFQTQVKHRGDSFQEISENKKIELLKNANRPVISGAINIRPEYFLEAPNSNSFEEDDELGLLGKFQLINKKYEEDVKNNHENVSVWIQKRKDPCFQRISERPDQEQT